MTDDPTPAHKLLIAIIHRDDTGPVSDALRAAGIRFTRLPSLGGFLGEPNETYLMAVEAGQVSVALAALEAVSHTREVEIPLVLLERLTDWQARTVAHGGATVLIVDLAAVVRL